MQDVDFVSHTNIETTGYIKYSVCITNEHTSHRSHFTAILKASEIFAPRPIHELDIVCVIN